MKMLPVELQLKIFEIVHKLKFKDSLIMLNKIFYTFLNNAFPDSTSAIKRNIFIPEYIWNLNQDKQLIFFERLISRYNYWDLGDDIDFWNGYSKFYYSCGKIKKV